MKKTIVITYTECLRHNLDLQCGAGLGFDHTGGTEVSVTRKIRNVTGPDEDGYLYGEVKIDRKILKVFGYSEEEEWMLDF